MQSERNAAPVWEPGMADITGTAAHPSMQRKTTAELRAKLAENRALRASALRFPSSEDRDELLESYGGLIAAYELALKWRAR